MSNRRLFLTEPYEIGSLAFLRDWGVENAGIGSRRFPTPQTLIEGTRIKHTLGKTSVKMYDKQDRVLRIETTTSDVSSFSCYRKVASRNGTGDIRWAPIRKNIYSLGRLAEAMGHCNRRYLEFI